MKILFDVSALPVPGFISRSIREMYDAGMEVMVTGQVKKGFKSPFGKIPIYNRPIAGWKASLFFCYRVMCLWLSQPARARHLWRWTNSFNFKDRIKEFNRLSIYYILRPDVIHIQWTKALMKLEYLLENKPCPITVSVRGTQMFVSPVDPVIDQKYRQLLPLVDRVHVVSEALAREVSAYTPQPVMVINPSISPEVPKKKNYKTQTPVQLITVTRFHWVKGINVLLDALSVLDFPWELTLVSSNALTEEYLYQLHDLKINDRVKIYTGLPHEEVLKILAEKDIFVFSSISEGRGNALLEAMAAGIPVVCSDFPGANELIENNENGWLYRNDDRDQLKFVLEKALAVSDITRAQKAAQAQKVIHSSFKPSKVLSQWQQFFKEVVA